MSVLGVGVKTGSARREQIWSAQRGGRVVRSAGHLDIELLAGPEAAGSDYLHCLNLCFPGWGGRDYFDWCFARPAGGPPADIFAVSESGRLIAGSATTYRRATRPGRGRALIGCMTATWTLRAARGRGLFERLIAHSRRQARKRGCELLIAFAGTGKASRPGLLAAGASDVEGAFLTSAFRGPVPSAPPVPEASLRETLDAFAARAFDPERARLSYGPGEWRGQMLDRPRPVERRRLGCGAVAVIERAGDVDRLLDVSCGGGQAFVAAVEAAAAISHAHGRRLSAYTLDPAVIGALSARGFAASRAWLYLMATDDSPPHPDLWWFANGDRM